MLWFLFLPTILLIRMEVCPIRGGGVHKGFEESYDEVYTQGDFIKLSDTFSEYLIKKYNGELPRN